MPAIPRSCGCSANFLPQTCTNKGLRVATGDYVWFLNAGDTLQSPEMVARLAEVELNNLLTIELEGTVG